MNAEQRLEQRIGRILLVAGFDQSPATDELKTHIVDLFREYSVASEEKKEEVYTRGEKRIMEVISASHALGATQPSN